MITDTLTGKTRYRAKKRLFGKPLLVLQVYVERSVHDPEYLSPRKYTYWRDATFEDLNPEGFKHANHVPV